MKIGRFLIGILLAIFIAGGWLGIDYYHRFFRPNVELSASSTELFIQSDWNFDDLKRNLYDQSIITDSSSFKWVATYKKYTDNVKPGKYTLFDGMNNNQLVNVLRSQNEPVMLLIRSVRTLDELVSNVSNHLELDSGTLANLLRDEGFCQRYGFTPQTVSTLFIPNTYEFYWNTTAEEFVERMAREYKRFWNDERKQKAGAQNLSQSEVAILASIVQSEQAAHPDERAKVAGLYLNRLKKGMRLESDPTLLFVINDLTIRRVYNKMKEIDSPYNTFKHAGLPPGPILLPETKSLDAVLNPEKHNYIFMCAKDDFSGYHNFATNYTQHKVYARQYRRALDQKKIYR